MRGPVPIDFIPGCFIESDAKGPAIHKYRSLLEKHNTPFSPIQASAAPAKRLWHYLVRQELVQDIFIRAVFGRKRTTSSTGFGTGHFSSAGDSGKPAESGEKWRKKTALTADVQRWNYSEFLELELVRCLSIRTFLLTHVPLHHPTSCRWTWQQQQLLCHRARSSHPQGPGANIGLLPEQREPGPDRVGHTARGARDGHCAAAGVTALDGGRMRAGHFEYDQRLGSVAVQQFPGHTSRFR